MKAPWRKRFALLLFAALAAQSGELRGQSLDGRIVHGVDSSGVAGLTVELHRVTSADGAVIDSTVSGPDGSFGFRLADEGPGALFLAAARRDGVLYFGPAIHLGQANEEPYEVLVYDTVNTSGSPPDMRVGIRHIVVAPDAGGGLGVAEVIDVFGPGDRTLVPVSASFPIWSAPLPEGARDPRVIEGGAGPDAIRFAEGRVELYSMVSPLGVRLTIAYSLPGSSAEFRFEHPTDRVDVVVADMTARVVGAAHAESTMRGVQSVQRWEATDVTAGRTIRVERVEVGRAGDRWVLFWAGIGVVLLAAAGALWRTGPG